MCCTFLEWETWLATLELHINCLLYMLQIVDWRADFTCRHDHLYPDGRLKIADTFVNLPNPQDHLSD